MSGSTPPSTNPCQWSTNTYLPWMHFFGQKKSGRPPCPKRQFLLIIIKKASFLQKFWHQMPSALSAYKNPSLWYMITNLFQKTSSRNFFGGTFSHHNPTRNLLCGVWKAKLHMQSSQTLPEWTPTTPTLFPHSPPYFLEWWSFKTFLYYSLSKVGSATSHLHVLPEHPWLCISIAGHLWRVCIIHNPSPGAHTFKQEKNPLNNYVWLQTHNG